MKMFLKEYKARKRDCVGSAYLNINSIQFFSLLIFFTPERRTPPIQKMNLLTVPPEMALFFSKYISAADPVIILCWIDTSYMFLLLGNMTLITAKK